MTYSIENFRIVSELAVSGAPALEVMFVAQNLGISTRDAKLALQRAHGYTGWINEYGDAVGGPTWK